MNQVYAPVRKEKWYVIDITNIRKPRHLHKSYETQGQANDTIQRFLNNLTFIAVRGHFLIHWNIPRSHKFYGHLQKYHYGENFTRQDKKSRRTLERYHQRRNRIKNRKVHKTITWVYPKYIKTRKEKTLYRSRIRFARLRKVKREY